MKEIAQRQKRDEIWKEHEMICATLKFATGNSKKVWKPLGTFCVPQLQLQCVCRWPRTLWAKGTPRNTSMPLVRNNYKLSLHSLCNENQLKMTTVQRTITLEQLNSSRAFHICSRAKFLQCALLREWSSKICQLC